MLLHVELPYEETLPEVKRLLPKAFPLRHGKISGDTITFKIIDEGDHEDIVDNITYWLEDMEYDYLDVWSEL